MKRTILSLSDFESQAAAILAASKAKRGDGLRMEDLNGDADDGAPGADDDADDGDDDSTDDDAPSGDDDKKDDGKDDDKSDTVDRAEYERVKRHRAAADRKVADLTTKVDTLTRENAALKADGKKPGDISSERETELTATITERENAIHELRIQNAFLSANQYSWHDAADALRLADLRDVEIEEDGTVVGLKEALDKLAKEKPHLIKAAAQKDEPKNSSGSSTNGRRKGESKKPDRAALSRTYPVLAARR